MTSHSDLFDPIFPYFSETIPIAVLYRRLFPLYSISLLNLLRPRLLFFTVNHKIRWLATFRLWAQCCSITPYLLVTAGQIFQVHDAGLTSVL